MRLFSICAHFGEENAVMCKGEDVRTCFKIVRETDVLERPVWLLKQSYVSNRAEVIRQMLSTQVEWPDDTEILLADMPPSTASEVFSFFDNMSGLLGCLFVTQPSGISVLGMRNTVYSLRLQKVPTTETMRRGYSPFIVPGGHRSCWPIGRHPRPATFFRSLTTWNLY